MIENRKVSICCPTYNRYQFTINAFAKVIDDERIDEFILNDDCSTDDSCERLVEYFKGNPKVKVYRNQKNEDCYRNKAISVHKATNEWVCLWDSDNIFDTDYLDALYAIPEWDKNTFYLPEFARIHFDARQWSGLTVTRENMYQYADTHLATNFNAMNFFINKEQYLKVWNGRVDPHSSDSIFFSYTWVLAGHKILITPNLQYQHTIHTDGSGHFTQNQHKTVEFHKILMDKIRNLR